MPRDRHRTPDGAPSSATLTAASRRLRIDVSAALQAMIDDGSVTRAAPPAGGDATDPRTGRNRNVQ